VTLPKWLGKSELDNVKDERNWATRRGGRTQTNSGRQWYAKGDTKDEILLSDTKETQRKSYTIRREDWQQLTRWALDNHRVPCLKIRFVGGDKSEIVVIPADFLEQLLDA
jgi:hypothetical protein